MNRPNATRNRPVFFGSGVEVRLVPASSVGPFLGVYHNGELFSACQSGSSREPRIDSTTWRMACGNARYLLRRKRLAEATL